MVDVVTLIAETYLFSVSGSRDTQGRVTSLQQSLRGTGVGSNAQKGRFQKGNKGGT